MNIIVSFSGREDGNCDSIAKYISAEGDLVLFVREISTQPCASSAYECMMGQILFYGRNKKKDCEKEVLEHRKRKRKWIPGETERKKDGD